MKGSKTIIFGISVAVCGLAMSSNSIIAIGGGVLGLLISIVGLCKQD